MNFSVESGRANITSKGAEMGGELGLEVLIIGGGTAGKLPPFTFVANISL